MEALQGTFESERVYFNEVLQLLMKYRWIYKCRNTDILIGDVLGCIPSHWIPVLQLDCLDNIDKATRGETEPSWPTDLSELVTQCWRLSLRINANCNEEVALKLKKVNPKKMHEVVNFSRLIGEHCKDKQIKHVVDIGAGLGYLDKELSDRWDVHVLGLERDAYRVSAANQRVETSDVNSSDQCRATYKELALNAEDSLEDKVESVIIDWLNELPGKHVPSSLCMIGLHSCGDLSPVMMKLFLKSLRFRTLLLVSCCYHRMEWEEGTSGDHFPLSQALKKEIDVTSDGAVPFNQEEGIQQLLRLAAQETPKHWLQQHAVNHRRQAQHTFYRAVFQLYSFQEGIQLLKQQRRPVRKDGISDCFSDYIDQALVGFGLQGDDARHRQNLMDIYSRNSYLVKSLETLIVLQVLLQPVAEALVLIDRLFYLRDSETCDVSLRQVFDDRISPRCFVTIAEKILDC